jgi:hypothetical protein
MIKINALIIFFLIFLCPIQTTSGSQNYFHFDENTKRLTINTKMLELSIEAGAIVYIKDKASNELLVNANSSDNFPISPQFPQGDPRLFLGFTSISPEGNHHYRLPRDPSVTYQIVSNHKAMLTYSPLHYVGNQRGGELTYGMNVDENSGEIVFQLTGIETEINQPRHPFTIDLPIINFKKDSVILGSGAKYNRGDPESKDRTSRPGLGLYSPSMAVAAGNGSCVAVWSESDKNISGEDVGLRHHPEYDHIIFHTPQDPKQENKHKIVSSPWRIGTYKDWVEAARRWRKRFEQRTKAKPLWENRATWVRKIHAVHAGRHFAKGSEYAQLANIVPPANLLYFMWNGDRIVLFGDHTLIAGIVAPQPRELQLIKKGGWRLLLYHPWTLYYSQAGANARLQKSKDKGWLQKNYQFHPDYEGTAVDWYNYWADVDTTYNKLPKDEGLNVIHPGSTKFKNYLVRNYRNWCATYQADGAYFDILGADMSAKFSAKRKIIEGQDYATGEKNAIARINKDLPNLAVMSEYLNSGLLPHVFYTWEGYSHVTQNGYAKTKINHPLRTALIGSYVWSQEQYLGGATPFNNEVSALLGALPGLSLVGDYKVSKSRALWSQARVKLFCQEELFNDLPPKWDPEALAYYRSKGGHWFKFKKLGGNHYAYVEEIPGGSDLIRLTTPSEKLNLKF